MDSGLKKRLEMFEDVHNRSAGDVAVNKINAFTSGLQKKSKREREKEAADIKRQQEEQDAAQAYRDFVASFDGDRTATAGSSSTRETARPGFRGFIRAGGSGSPAGPSNQSGYEGIPSGPRAAQAPPDHKQPQTAAIASQSSSNKPVAFEDEDDDVKPIVPLKKKRAMDSYLEELKREQADRESRLQSRVAQGVATSVSAAAAEDLGRGSGTGGGSHDNGDPLTTNLHVGNLPANVTTNSIGLHFAQYGPVGSVKIMWPRDAMGTTFGEGSNMAAARGGLNGFIAFMRRSDAEKALKECDGVEWGGSVLRLGWGKAMPLPPQASFVIEAPYQRSRRSMSPVEASSRRRRSRSPDDAPYRRGSDYHKRSRRSASPDSRSRSRSPDGHRQSRRRYSDDRRSRSRSRERGRTSDNRRYRSRSRSRSPRDRRWPKLESEKQRDLLESIARKMKQHGKRFEDTLKDKERNNPDYDFLRVEKLPSYHYFRMLMDRHYRAPSPPPAPFVEDGDAEVVSSDDSEYEDEMKKNKRGVLGPLPRRRLEAMVRTVLSTRESIARVMAFALDRSDAAEEVVEVLIQSLTILSTPVPRKLARLNIISDILHNCAGSLTNAWKYRSLFETRLPEVFSHLGDIHGSFPGRMKAEIFRKQFMTVVDIWENWLVFTPTVLQDFEKRLSNVEETEHAAVEPPEELEVASETTPREQVTSVASVTAIKSGFRPAGFVALGTMNSEEHVDGEVIVQAPSVSAAEDMDLDGEALDGEDMDGAPM